MKNNRIHWIAATMVLAGLLAGSAHGQEYKNYVVASGKLVEKSKVKELTGVLREKNLWITGADRQTHPACIVQPVDSSRGFFVLDYRPAKAVGSTVRISVVPTAPVAHPDADVRSASGGLDISIDGNRSARCYAAVRDATPIDYKLATQKAGAESE